MTIAGVILAAGAARRMGCNKLLLRLDGEPLVHRAARRANAAGLSPIVLVLGHEADQVRAAVADLPCEFTLNPDFTGPTSGSLHCGLRCLHPGVEAAVVMLADMVRITEQMLVALVQAAHGSRAPLIVSRYGDITAPPLLFRRQLFDELLAWTGEGCGKAIVQRHFHDAVILDWPPADLADVDTREEFAAIEATAIEVTSLRSPLS